MVKGATCTEASSNTACATINFAVSNGLGSYVTPATLTTTAGTFSCPISSTTYQCSSADITGSGAPTLSLAVSETGNASTPGTSKTDATKTLTINPEMTFTATPTSPFADAVAARTYGVGSNCGAGGGNRLHTLDLHDSERQRSGRLYLRIFAEPWHYLHQRRRDQLTALRRGSRAAPTAMPTFTLR